MEHVNRRAVGYGDQRAFLWDASPTLGRAEDRGELPPLVEPSLSSPNRCGSVALIFAGAAMCMHRTRGQRAAWRCKEAVMRCHNDACIRCRFVSSLTDMRF